ncbi:hypothetical protein SBA1_610025 [Candidatus Sulfotelmatobacter kueseliae]|uniref:Uncharacterized protein n=1 Tax=Candidatus Sulfotelmatobacter kueseliae TaxID=2042962 RepID=A0A2U3L1U5_9BACT|nr:hypothetical protein SBA1_610025 [Candidatus Sulfotelmatobacter kueseliae]
MICNYAVYAAHRPFTDEGSGHTTAQNPEARKVLFELLNSSLAQLGPERNGQTLNGIALKLAERFARRLLSLDKLPPSTTQSPVLGSTTVPLTGACVNASPFRKAGGICSWGQAHCQIV